MEINRAPAIEIVLLRRSRNAETRQFTLTLFRNTSLSTTIQFWNYRKISWFSVTFRNHYLDKHEISRKYFADRL